MLFINVRRTSQIHTTLHLYLHACMQLFFVCALGSVCQCAFVSLTVCKAVCVYFLRQLSCPSYSVQKTQLHLLLAQHIGPANWSRLCIRVEVSTVTPLGMTHLGLKHKRTPAFKKHGCLDRILRITFKEAGLRVCVWPDLEWHGSAVYLDCAAFRKYVLESIIANRC